MAITNFANLKTSIIDWSHRTDISDSLVNDFIDLAESEMWKKLRLRDMETRSTDTASASSRFLSLPTNYVFLRKLVLISGNNHYPLVYRTPESMQINPSSGLPKFFTITSQFEFDRIPDQAYSVEIQHYAKLTALSASNTTNAVLTNYPSVYLFGALHFLQAWAANTEKSLAYYSKFQQAIDEANGSDRRGRYGSAPSAIKEGSTP